MFLSDFVLFLQEDKGYTEEDIEILSSKEIEALMEEYIQLISQVDFETDKPLDLKKFEGFIFMKFGLILYFIWNYYKWYYTPVNNLYFNPLSIIFSKEKIENHVYAVDFDNTICYTDYPKIIKPLPYAMEVLRILSNNPYSILILNTCREGKELEDAVRYCETFGVKFDYINENAKERIEIYKTNPRKIGADVYIDDRSYEGINGVETLWKNWWDWMKENGYN